MAKKTKKTEKNALYLKTIYWPFMAIPWQKVAINSHDINENLSYTLNHNNLIMAKEPK